MAQCCGFVWNTTNRPLFVPSVVKSLLTMADHSIWFPPDQRISSTWPVPKRSGPPSWEPFLLGLTGQSLERKCFLWENKPCPLFSLWFLFVLEFQLIKMQGRQILGYWHKLSFKSCGFFLIDWFRERQRDTERHRETEGEKCQFVVPVSCAFTGCFLCVSWPEVSPATGCIGTML